MSEALYNLFLRLYYISAALISRWNPKARLWINGQQGALKAVRDLKLKQSIWVHCASLGEYEQAWPIIDQLLLRYPQYPLLVSFFSPSGYEIVKDKATNFLVCYLPLDGKRNAISFIEAVDPILGIFVKYEHWHFYTLTLQQQSIPILSVSAIFRQQQHYYKWYGGFFRQMLMRYSHILVQDEQSKGLLNSIGINNVIVGGDTRFDRVAAIKESNTLLPIIQGFKGQQQLVVAGSTWPADEALLAKYINEGGNPNVKWVIVPHNVDSQHINGLIEKLKIPYTLYSKGNIDGTEVLIVDTIGILSKVYRYANVAYIGGGFGAGIHNTLEAAVYGVPIIFGPKYQKFNEAVALIDAGGAVSISNYNGLQQQLVKLLSHQQIQRQMGEASAHYVQQHMGATQAVMDTVQQLIG